MRNLRTLPLAALLLVSSPAGCRRPADPCAAPDREPAASMACRLGDRHAMVLMLHAERFAKTRKDLLPWIALAVQGARVERALTEASDAWGALRNLAALAGREFPERLDGLDLERPLALGLFETEGEALAEAVELLAAEPGARMPFWERHRLLVPATDAKVLLGSLGALLARSGLARLEVPGAPVDRETWFAHEFAGDRGVLGLIAEERHVRVEIASRPDPEAEPASAREFSSAPAPARTLTRTPAFQALCRNDDLVTLYLRPWRFRSLSIQRSLSLIRSALSAADPSFRATLLAQGVSEVLSGYLWMSPLGAEMDDTAIGLSFSGELSLQRVSSLTELGQRIFAVARQKEGPASTGEKALAEGRLAIDLRRALAAAEEPEALRRAETLEHVFMIPRECGTFCLWYSPLCQWLGLGKALLRLGGPKAASLLPAAGAAVLTSTGMEFSQLRLALAADFPADADLATLRELARAIESEGALRGSEVPLTIEKVRERQEALLGINQDPRKFFVRRAIPEGLLAEARIDLAEAARLAGIQPEFAPLASLSELRCRLRVSGRALVMEAALGLAGTAKARIENGPEFADSSWESPGLAAEASAGGRCLLEIVAGTQSALRAVAMADPAQKGVLLAEAIADLEPRLSCAQKDEHTRAAAERIAAALSLFSAELLLDDFSTERALAMLAAACEKGNGRACARKEREEKAPRIQLAEVGHGCASSGAFGPRNAAARLGANGATLLPDAFAEDLLLAIDREAPFSSVAKLASGLPPAVKTIELPVRDGDGNRRALFVTRSAARPDPEPDELVVLLRPTPGGAELSGPGGTLAIDRPPECQNRPECPEMTRAVTDTVQKVKTHFPRGRLYLDAPADTPWRRAAVLLAGAGCPEPFAENPAWTVFLGPAPERAAPPAQAPALRDTRDGKPALVTGPYNKEDIRRVIRMNLARFRYCYELVLMQDPAASPAVDIRFTIGPKGTVIDAQASPRKQGSPRLEACLEKTIRQLRFPAPLGGGVVTVTYPFNFQPGD